MVLSNLNSESGYLKIKVLGIPIGKLVQPQAKNIQVIQHRHPLTLVTSVANIFLLPSKPTYWLKDNSGKYDWWLHTFEYIVTCMEFKKCFFFQYVIVANILNPQILPSNHSNRGGWGCEVSCGGHHRLRGKTTTGSALDGAVFDIAQKLAYLVHNMSRSQLYLGFGHFGWLPSFFGQ